MDAVVLGEPDCLVEAPAPRRRGDYVPKADPLVGQPLQPLLIRQPLQFFTDGASEQAPELVRGMRVVTTRRQRCVPGQAPKNEQPRVGPGDRRQTGFDAQE